MNTYKKVAKKDKPPFSFVAAVTKFGDLWYCATPDGMRATDPMRTDALDAVGMRLMERGEWPRVEAPLELNDYEPIVVNFNGLVWTATRAWHDMGDPYGFDSRDKFRAIIDLLDQEEMRREM